MSQQPLIECMKSLGFLSNSDGVCFGVAHMALQAILANDISSFNKRINLIYQTSLDNLQAKLKIIQQKQRNQSLNTNEKLYFDIPAFFNGIELFQQLYLYPHIKKTNIQDAISTLPLTLPVNIEKQGLIIERVDCFSGIYHLDNLINYFFSLRQVLSETQPKSIGFVCESINHVITFSFDAATKAWIFVDANQLPVQLISNDKEMAEKILYAFSHNSIVAMTTSAYGLSDSPDLLTTMLYWRATDRFKNLHFVTKEKALLSDSNQGTWLMSAVESKEVSKVAKLLPLMPTLLDAYSLLVIAIQLKSVGLVEVLLQDNRIDPNEVIDGDSPLTKAINLNEIAIIATLLKTENIDINLPVNGKTPIELAIERNAKDTIALLIQDNRLMLTQAIIDKALIQLKGKKYLDIVTKFRKIEAEHSSALLTSHRFFQVQKRTDSTNEIFLDSAKKHRN